MSILLSKITCDKCGTVYEFEDYAPDLAESLPDGCLLYGEWWCQECITCKCGCFCVPGDCNCEPGCLDCKEKR